MSFMFHPYPYSDPEAVNAVTGMGVSPVRGLHNVARTIAGLLRAGKRVPDDISIIGYDGLKIGSFYTPKLSTVCQSVELLARRSFMVLMDCTEHGGPARHLTVPFTLSNRESVRKLESD